MTFDSGLEYNLRMEIKYCKTCNQNLPLTEFSQRRGTTPSSKCKACQREYAKQYYNKNKQKYIERNILYNGKIRDEVLPVIEALKSEPCLDCKVGYPPYVMDFDHRDPSTKYKGISEMVGTGYKLDRILEEIEKCDLICSNCHRIRTYNRRIALLSIQ